MTDAEALDTIARMLRSPDWAVSYLEDIAEIVAGTGRQVGELLPGETAWPRH